MAKDLLTSTATAVQIATGTAAMTNIRSDLMFRLLSLLKFATASLACVSCGSRNCSWHR
eukprot:jgi/Botrbrau1/10096/Bobra.20_2s0004.1